MILSELRDYIKIQQKVAMVDIANHFQMDADVLRAMLDKWVSKGKIKKTSLETGCGTSCCKCDPNLTDIFEWVD